ncbi:protein lifeguard 4-like isoform X2 [Sinocyclocheilus grahami]|uniref:Protein lifeguard 4-like n=2 Tax=Sinocyclocheilus TaxID=75365 RepID=A0A672JXH4_SINGR|nr:PREDICTED: protein lifeguard 4-like isoform X1 [Sinocyclocheilus grahami]XP_016109455.1 PREDICTED: protein lifeguard 4-like isoform X1 [Sinocyclocheilus grahami]XP_016110155.1 PREDICTED: protein lifeguard 4-like isoform X2 [Sinocyclocheilus grahami]
MNQEQYPRSSIEDDFNYGTNVATASVHIRMDFLRKVYTILSLQIIVTTAVSALFMLCNPIKNFVHESPSLVLISAIGSLILLLALAVYRHQHPINLYLLFGFTLLESLSVATAVTFYEYTIVLQAFVLTSAVFLGLTAYTFQSKRDFSKLGASLFAGLWILIIASFMRLFFYNDTMELVFAGAGALLFCGFIIFDTHLLMHKLSPEEHVLASINLYLDIVNLFIYILRILDSMKKH